MSSTFRLASRPSIAGSGGDAGRRRVLVGAIYFGCSAAGHRAAIEVWSWRSMIAKS